MKIFKPNFELTNVYDDGTIDNPQIVPVTQLPWETKSSRRGFLGAGISLGTLFAVNGPLHALSDGTDSSNSLLQNEATEIKAHSTSVNALAFSPDGKILASGSDGNAMKIWSIPEGNLLISEIEPKSAQIVNSLDFSPDGTLLASGNGDSNITLWHMPATEQLKELKGHGDVINDVKFSPDGKWLASGSKDRTTKIWKLPEGTTLKTLDDYAYFVNSVAFSPDGKMLVTGSQDSRIKIWQLPEGTLTKTLVGHTLFLNAVAISPDGKILASASGDSTVKLWQLPEGNLLSTLEGHSFSVNAIAFSPDGKMLASGSGDNLIKLWEVPTGKLVNTLNGHGSVVISLAFHPEGDLLASGAYDGVIRLWDLRENQLATYLYDPVSNKENAITYHIYNKLSQTTITYTLPCGSPIPKNATCTCNCVAGNKIPEYTGKIMTKEMMRELEKQRIAEEKQLKKEIAAKKQQQKQKQKTTIKKRSTRSTRTRSRRYCSCVPVCTCQAVCQAHNLLHPDTQIRTLAKEILLFMGRKELDYMYWAANETKDLLLRKHIKKMITAIRMGAESKPEKWLSIEESLPYLDDSEPVVRIMAAQMIQLQTENDLDQLPILIQKKIRKELTNANDLHWLKKKNNNY